MPRRKTTQYMSRRDELIASRRAMMREIQRDSPKRTRPPPPNMTPYLDELEVDQHGNPLDLPYYNHMMSLHGPMMAWSRVTVVVLD